MPLLARRLGWAGPLCPRAPRPQLKRDPLGARTRDLMVRLTLMSVFILTAALSACDQDPFHRAERTIADTVRLMQWEDETTYYLLTPETRDSIGGLIEGTVRRIGWDSSYIVVERHPIVGDSLDWVVIDVHSARVAGPYGTDQFLALPHLPSIPLITPDNAWARVH